MAEGKPDERTNPASTKSNPGDAPDAEPQRRHMIPVWFFVGMLLLVYGILIFIEGVREWSHPPHTVLANLHPPVWWGILLVIMGLIFTLKHFPRKNR